jgi:precorrin-8X/cobalt-precorrin-8 methylmutase
LRKELASEDLDRRHYSGTAARRDMSKKAFDIEKRSFEIIESEIGIDHHYDEIQWVIVRRVIHATADFDFAGKSRIIFHKKAIDSAFDALKNKCTIVTDVDMVLAAISKRSITNLGLGALCYITDATVAEQARRSGKTRSETAMRHAARNMDGGIVAVGNAPTALYEVLNMIRERVTKPALIIGTPVGFVAAAEAKEELSKIKDVPFITNVGRKGGSSAASAIINAIMLLYQSKVKSPT